MESIIFALLGALFTSLTTILVKIGIKDVNSNFATFYRTGIVIVFSAVLCACLGLFPQTASFSWENWLFLVLSGVSTGLSWLFYFKAIKLGSINKVAPIDKSSFILTSILFLIFFYSDATKGGDPLILAMTILAMALMLGGTILMIDKKEDTETISSKWLLYAILSAVFASLVSFFAKIGLQGINSNLGTFYRTIVVFVFAAAIVLVKKDYKGVKQMSKKSWIFLTLSAIATGLAWIMEYAALNVADSNPIAVSAIGKLSILLTMLFSFLVLKEKFTKKSLFGLTMLVSGIAIIAAFSL